MMTQRKLDTFRLGVVQRVIDDIYAAFDYDIYDAFDVGHTPEGVDYWDGFYRKLQLVLHHGTSDGKPWVEPVPEPRIPTDEDAKRRPRVRGGNLPGKPPLEGVLVAVINGRDDTYFYVKRDRIVDIWTRCELIDELEATT